MRAGFLRNRHLALAALVSVVGMIGSTTGPASAEGTAPALSIRQGDVIRGDTIVYATGSPPPSISLDGDELGVGPAPSLPVRLHFEGDGIQSGSQKLLNSVWVNGRLVTLIDRDYSGYAAAEITVPAGYLTAGANTVTI